MIQKFIPTLMNSVLNLGDGIDRPTPDPKAAFGYGRRICPGVALILAAFDMSPPVGESGKPKEIELDYINGFVSEHRCSFRLESSG